MCVVLCGGVHVCVVVGVCMCVYALCACVCSCVWGCVRVAVSWSVYNYQEDAYGPSGAHRVTVSLQHCMCCTSSVDMSLLLRLNIVL